MLIPEDTKPHTIAQWESVVKHKNYRFLGIDIEISSFRLYKGYVMSVKGSFREYDGEELVITMD